MMMARFILGLFFFTGMTAVAHPTLGKLIACEPLPTQSTECNPEVCILPPTEDYPRPTILLVPNQFLTKTPAIRVHFHGWTQEGDGTPRNPSYDFSWLNPRRNPNLSDAKKMVSAFGFEKSVCSSHPEFLLIPISRGHNDDHKQYFTTPVHFQSYLNNILLQLGDLNTYKIDLRLSAHSGGGKILSQILDFSDARITQIKLIDATYDTTTAQKMNLWIQNNEALTSRRLEVISVTPGTQATSNLITLDGTSTSNADGTLTCNPRSCLQKEIRSDALYNHYTIVNARWESHLE